MTTKLCAMVALMATLVASTRTPSAPAGTSVSVFVEPVTLVLAAGMNGTVERVLASAGSRVSPGERLIELRAPELDAAEAARRLEHLAADLPPAARQAWIEAHRQTATAEAAYVQALTDLDHHPQDNALRRRVQTAGQERQAVRARLAHLLDQATSADLAPLVRQLRDRATLKAPDSDATVELLEVRPGQRVHAGQPLAILTLEHEYTAELVLPASLRAPSQLRLHFAGRTISATVGSVAQRDIPFGFRKDRRVASERVARLRFHSSLMIAPGTPALVEWP